VLVVVEGTEIGIEGGAEIDIEGGAEIDIEEGAEIDIKGGVEITAPGETEIDTDEAGHFRMIDEGAIQGIQVAGMAKAIRDIAETTQRVIRLLGRDPPEVAEGRTLQGTAGGPKVPGL